MERIAVIGAGISGLICAYELQKAGYEVEVFEKNSYVGGRMSTRVKDGFHFDIGADHLCNVYKELIKYCEELDVKWEKMRFSEYQVFRNGELPTIMEALSFYSRMRFLLYMSLFRKKKDVNFLDLSTVTQYDNKNAYDYIEKKLGPEIVDYIVDPFTSTYEFHRTTQMTKGAVIGVMQSIKYNKDDWDLHRTKGGMIALPNALASKLKVNLNKPIKSIEVQEDGVKITANYPILFDAVVCASTANVTRKIFNNPTDEQKELLDSVKYSSTVSVAFTVPEGTLKKSGIFWVPYKENISISGYVNQEMKGEEAVNNGRALLSVWLHSEFAKGLLNKSDDEIFSAVKKEFLKVCPLIKDESILENHDLERWEAAMPLFYQGYITKVKEFLGDGQGKNGVFLCGDYLNSPWTEGSLRCGQRVARRVIDFFSGKQ